MIELRGVSYRYPEAPRPALQGIDLAVRDGEWVLLAGPSGCGKSTLLYLINGLIPQVIDGELNGEAVVDGLRPAQVPIRELSRRVGTVFQNPELQLFMLRTEEDVAFGCENLGMAPEETHRRTDSALARLSLNAIRRQEVFTLSGGQKQRLAIAGALATGTRILLLDEPTSDLDDRSRAELLASLRELHDAGHTVVMTEHRLDGLAGLVDRVLTMEDGRIVCNGACPAPCSLALRPPAQVDNEATVLVEAEAIEFAYPGRERVLADVSFHLRAGEVVALTGANGCGKTTLLKLLCGLLRPQKGRLRVAGISQPALRDLVGAVGFLFQNPDEQIFTDRVADEIAFGPHNFGRTVDLDRYLNQTRLGRYREAHPRSLSRGERQRLAAAAVLAMRPKVILLDEPTTGLDQPAWSALMELVVAEARESEACVLFSTHHGEAADAFASRRLRIDEGRLVDDGLP
ncbi:MAG: ABC transporter ATP-binding protein [Thermoguttaceae bacterium]|jgi:energy-coupling factor transporter ATP-binding protein EcfA2